MQTLSNRIIYLYKIAICIIIFCIPIYSLAQNGNTQEPWDNSIVDYRKPSADTIKYYQSLSEYQYEPVPKSNYSLWDKFLDWLRQHFRIRTDSNIDWVKLMLIILAAITFTVIIIYLFGIKINGLLLFSRKINKQQIETTSQTDDINDNRLNQYLENHIRNNNYREATRILYLICLRELDSNNLIKWDISKTNRDYFYEISHVGIKEKFRNIVRFYEYVWYGQFMIDVNGFNDMQNTVNSIITNSKKAY
ncbi:MAG: hypothetical protein JW717_09010 [Marinilabiliaceae bacterium]|nr:hypothetical protein [Marinilabiliaceae bacterium]